MSGQPIPNDWNGIDYCYLSAKVPDSVMWRGVVRGAIHRLSAAYHWDKATGDTDAAAAVAEEIFNSMLTGCDDPVVPLYFQRGWPEFANKNVYKIRSHFDGTAHRIIVKVNNTNPDTWLDAGIYSATVLPSPTYDSTLGLSGEGIRLRDRAGNDLDILAIVDNYCGPNFGRIDMYSTAPFWAIISIGAACP